MAKRFASIWFPYLVTDWFIRHQPRLKDVSFVLAYPDHGRMMVAEVSRKALGNGVERGMVVADARAILPAIEILDNKPEYAGCILKALGEWAIRFTPEVAVDLPYGLILNVTGCTHLWGGEQQYMEAITKRLNGFGYDVRIAIADTIGTAWALARYGKTFSNSAPGQQHTNLLSLPVASLRIEVEISARLIQLGLRQIRDIISMPRNALSRRFGTSIVKRIDQALGTVDEGFTLIQPVSPYQERLPCLDPIVNAKGIEIGLQQLLKFLCLRLQKEQQGLRMASLKCFRVDGRLETVSIGTNRPTANPVHIFKLFEYKLPGIEPALGIELFVLEATKVEPLQIAQSGLWNNDRGLKAIGLGELLDRIGGKVGADRIQRFQPSAHYWPERCFKPALALDEQVVTEWKLDRPRPVQLLTNPEPIEVMAPIPDYPPMLFRHKGILHKIKKADGPERIEPEWWIQEGLHRDYYYVEDEQGDRYWIFRLGHYDAGKTYRWFLHGFFA